jgi:V/A-type H+-transporting ATPase subunit F
MKKIIFMTPPDAEPGFHLAGIAHHVVEAAEAGTALRKVTADPDAGLIVLDERLLEGLGEEAMREVEKDWPGIVLVMPSPEKLPPEKEDYAARLIRRAIGYHVRLSV